MKTGDMTKGSRQTGHELRHGDEGDEPLTAQKECPSNAGNGRGKYGISV